jgi:hypothetical protein
VSLDLPNALDTLLTRIRYKLNRCERVSSFICFSLFFSVAGVVPIFVFPGLALSARFTRKIACLFPDVFVRNRPERFRSHCFEGNQKSGLFLTLDDIFCEAWAANDKGLDKTAAFSFSEAGQDSRLVGIGKLFMNLHRRCLIVLLLFVVMQSHYSPVFVGNI